MIEKRVQLSSAVKADGFHLVFLMVSMVFFLSC